MTRSPRIDGKELPGKMSASRQGAPPALWLRANVAWAASTRDELG